MVELLKKLLQPHEDAYAFIQRELVDDGIIQGGRFDNR
jgi:hypothetical protein